jgi:hypothetical protein
MHQTALVGCALALVAWALTMWIEPPGTNIPRYVALALAAWVVWLVAIRITIGLPTEGGRRDLVFILAIGLVMRLIVAVMPPTLSDDVYRAVWDARLLHAGINPYQFAPAAPELAALRDDMIWPRVNHQAQHTPYPPLAEVLGAIAYAVWPERLQAMQLLFGAMDLAAAGLVAALLHRLGHDPRRCLVLAWSPLGTVHFAHSAHNDSAMVAAFVAAALLLSANRRWLAMGMLGLSTMVKGVPALTVPAFARATGLRTITGWAISCALVTLPFAGAGAGLIAGVASEGSGQHFNDSVHLVVERAAGFVTSGEGASRVASVATVVITLSVAAVAWLQGGHDARGALVAGSRVWAAYLLAAPVVQPWYLSWLAPLIAVTVRPGVGWRPFSADTATAWLWWSGTITLTELSYVPGGLAWWVPIRVLEYGPVYLLLGLAGLRWWHRRRDEGRS